MFLRAVVLIQISTFMQNVPHLSDFLMLSSICYDLPVLKYSVLTVYEDILLVN